MPLELHNQIVKRTVIVYLNDISFASFHFQHRYLRYLLVLIEDFSSAVLYAIEKLNRLCSLKFNKQNSRITSIVSFSKRKKKRLGNSCLTSICSQEVEGSMSLTVYSRPTWSIQYIVVQLGVHSKIVLKTGGGVGRGRKFQGLEEDSESLLAVISVVK